MGDWVKVEFLVQVPDGMRVTEVDQQRTMEELARFFGFARVTGLTLEQVSDGKTPPNRGLLDERPGDGTRIWPST